MCSIYLFHGMTQVFGKLAKNLPLNKLFLGCEIWSRFMAATNSLFNILFNLYLSNRCAKEYCKRQLHKIIHSDTHSEFSFGNGWLYSSDGREAASNIK